MNSQLITSILNETESAESNESFVAQEGFVEENFIDEEENFYPYQQNKKGNGVEKAYSFQDEISVNSPFTNLESFETGNDTERFFNETIDPEQVSELEQYESFGPGLSNPASHIADEGEHFHDESIYEEMPGEIDEEENEFAHKDLADENSYEGYAEEEGDSETGYKNNGGAYGQMHDIKMAEVIESQIANIKSSPPNTKPCESYTCWG